MKKWTDKLNIPFTPENPIYPTRANYISDGLTNNKEIALFLFIERMLIGDEIFSIF